MYSKLLHHLILSGQCCIVTQPTLHYLKLSVGCHLSHRQFIALHLLRSAWRIEKNWNPCVWVFEQFSAQQLWRTNSYINRYLYTIQTHHTLPSTYTVYYAQLQIHSWATILTENGDHRPLAKNIEQDVDWSCFLDTPWTFIVAQTSYLV